MVASFRLTTATAFVEVTHHTVSKLAFGPYLLPLMCAPLRTAKQLLGFIYLDSTFKTRIFKPEHRGEYDHRMGWYIIVGSIPIGVVGFAARDVIKGDFKSR